MNIITLKEKNTGKEYDIMRGVEMLFDHDRKEVIYCTEDEDESQFTELSYIFDIEGQEVHFWEIDRIPFNTIKDMAEVIRIHEMESDQQYMKDNGEHAKGCQGCDFEQDNVNNEPCSSCVDFCNYTPKNKPLEPLLMFSVGELYFMAYPGHTGDQVHDYFRANDLNNITTTPEKINAAKKELIKIINSKEVKVTDPETLDNTIEIKPQSEGDET